MAEADWHLQEWMALKKRRQADLLRDLGWTRRKASEVFNGDQPYKRDIVNELAAWLEIHPHELLMSPERANRLRAIEEAAYAIAANSAGEAPSETRGKRARALAPTTPPPVKKAS